MPVDFIELFHGTNLVSAMDILNRGFNMQAALESAGTGDALWTTTSHDDALFFAKSHPAGGHPAILKILLPVFFIAQLQQKHYLWIDGPVHRFAPEAMDDMNKFAKNSLV
jgi:hypothetical protein